MKIIEKLSDMIEEEIEDAGKYAKCAINYKEEDPALAEMFYKLATAEMEHMKMLHDQVMKKINDYKEKNGDPPQHMLMLYDILHKKHIKNAAEVKGMLALYK